MPGFTKDTHKHLSSQVILWISWYHDIQVSSHSRPHSRDKAVSSCALNWALCKHSTQLHDPWFYAASLTCQQKEKEGKQAWSLHIPQYISACSTELHWPTDVTKTKCRKRSRQLLNGDLKWDAGSRMSDREHVLAQRSSVSTGAAQLWHWGKEQQVDQTVAHLLGGSSWHWAMVLCRLGGGEALQHTRTGPGHWGGSHKPQDKSWHVHRVERATAPYHRP